jgi:hypothetical protein
MKRICSVAVLVSLWLLAISTPTVFAASPDNFCQGKRDGKVSDPAVTRTYEKGIGFNPAQYVMQSYSTSLKSADPAREREDFRSARLKAFVTEHGAAMLDVPAVLSIIDRTDWSSIESRKTLLGSAVGIYAERGEVDCRLGSYTYSVEFLMPKNPLQVLPYPLRTALETAVDQAVSQSFNGTLNDVLTFRLDDIVERIRRTLAANEHVSRETSKPDSSLRLLHPRFRQLFPQDVQFRQNVQRGDSFGVGEYRLSPEMAYVMEQILRRFLRRPELDRDSFSLTVKGYADAKPVREIPYAGTCEIDARPNAVIELAADSRGAVSQTTTITSNSQLSIARGCEGARFAKSLIPASRRIRVFYGGVGAIAGAASDAYRGIELRLERSL